MYTWSAKNARAGIDKRRPGNRFIAAKYSIMRRKNTRKELESAMDKEKDILDFEAMDLFWSKESWNWGRAKWGLKKERG